MPLSPAACIGVIDVGSGNVGSVCNALQHLGLPFRRVFGPDDLQAVSHIVLPGVGAFATLMDRLEGARLIPALRDAVFERGVPYLGICVGMQILADVGLEFGERAGLGWVPGRCEPLRSAAAAGLPVPHMGWNDVEEPTPDAEPLLTGLSADKGERVFYFVHSFHLVPTNPSHASARSDYGGPVTAMVRRGHIVGVQFHPEKSQAAGLSLLQAFAASPRGLGAI